ncbi:murein L,D-transpeptidase [Hydrogenobacter sp. Uz 6-8]|uniref:L,D-transpeptidase family protein n=1 Tax=Hydrogenobacter sp. Uz 6-8 TaxID=3384828 RepID=UPI0038FBFC0F
MLRLAYDLYYGRTRPSELYRGWSVPKRQDRVVEKVAALIREERLGDLLREITPKSQEYWFLVEQAKSLQELSSIEWKPIRLSRHLRHGDRSTCLEEIRFRLFLLGDIREYTPSDFFDHTLLEAVKRFQKRHGLPETGTIGSKTIAELNISPEERLMQVYLNLEKHRWLPEDFERAVVVNIPSFELFLINKNSVELHSKVIVGRNYREDFRPTPILYSRIESLTINPSWHVPRSISVKDILPRVRKDPDYLRKKSFRVFLGGEEVDPLQIDWSLYSEKNFPFRLVQSPGPQNALGRIKFNFQNPFDVYLHDTPDVELFKKPKRAFSSGCIRVEKAKELALALLGEGWNSKKLENLIKEQQTQTLSLRNPIPIYILYLTAFERDGELHFREDIYGYDTILSRALSKVGGRK